MTRISGHHRRLLIAVSTLLLSSVALIVLLIRHSVPAVQPITPMASWRTYTDYQAQYRVGYPPTYSYHTVSSDGAMNPSLISYVTFDDTGLSAPYGYPTILVVRANGRSFGSSLAGYRTTFTTRHQRVYSERQFRLDNAPAAEFTVDSGVLAGPYLIDDVIIAQWQDKIYHLQASNSYDGKSLPTGTVFHTMLASFHFL